MHEHIYEPRVASLIVRSTITIPRHNSQNTTRYLVGELVLTRKYLLISPLRGWRTGDTQVNRVAELQIKRRSHTESRDRETHVCRLCARSMRYWNIHGWSGVVVVCVCVAQRQGLLSANARYLRPWSPWFFLVVHVCTPCCLSLCFRRSSITDRIDRFDARPTCPRRLTCRRARVASPRDRQPRTERARGVATLTRPDDVALPARSTDFSFAPFSLADARANAPKFSISVGCSDRFRRLCGILQVGSCLISWKILALPVNARRYNVDSVCCHSWRVVDCVNQVCLHPGYYAFFASDVGKRS